MQTDSATFETKTRKTKKQVPQGKCERITKQISLMVVKANVVDSLGATHFDQYSKKIELDKFYTKESVAIACLKLLGDLDYYDLVIEPSAGNGSFFRNINHKNKIGLDLKPEYETIREQDWFTLKIDKRFKKVLIVGNPPFGKRTNCRKILLNMH